MAAASETAASKMQDFFDTYSSEQIGELMQALQATQGKNAGGAGNGASTMTVKAGVTAKRTGKKQRNKRAKLERAIGGPKRPLNSWMAFRKYYNGSLAPNTQKAISKVLTVMWRADPFEAKWAMLAKAYSVLRGSREKEDAPLDEFLGLCAPLIGVITPDEYQQVMGWKLTPADQDDKEKVPTLVRIFVPNFPVELTTTTLSVDDLIQRCHAAGYIKDGGQETVAHSTSGSLTMAVQPTATHLEGMLGPVQASNGVPINMSEQDNMLPALSPTDIAFQNAMSAAVFEAPAGATALAEATVALSDLCTQWPHNEAFDPSSDFEITYDPNNGDPWDAQDLCTTTNGDIDWDGLVYFPPN